MEETKPRRPVSVGSASGAVTDRVENLAELAKAGAVDFIVGDWMSEYNMAIRGVMKATQDDDSSSAAAFEGQFLASFKQALPDIYQSRIKMAINAGASDTKRLYDQILACIQDRGLDLAVAWVEGDEVIEAVRELQSDGHDFQNITTEQMLKNWQFNPIYAQCYLGSWGIVEALRNGADIVVCGRVADAAPTMAAAAYWHGWSRDSYEELAHSLIAGHLIECSYYVTGGNYSGFKSLPQGSSPLLKLPIAKIQHDGTFFIETADFSERSGGVTVDTCRSQLLYELQGKRYYNSDVVAILDQIKIEQVKQGSVYVHNVHYEKPPPTTKVGMVAQAGFQAEVHYFLVGLDVHEKAAMLERQLRSYLDVDSFSLLKFTVSGVAASNPSCQDAATVDFRIFAQAPTEAALAPTKFLNPCWNIVMSTYPGATFAVSASQALPRPYNEYFVTMIPQGLVRHTVHIPQKGISVCIAAPEDTKPYVHHQEIEECTVPLDLSTFGPTTKAPLGYVVHARSGDKGSDCNIGFYTRHEDEYPWLRSLLSVDTMKTLLGSDYNGKRIERFELPNIQAVHFLLKDHLDRGVAASSTYDVLGKNVAEYIRARHVDIPDKFLSRGQI